MFGEAVRLIQGFVGTNLASAIGGFSGAVDCDRFNGPDANSGRTGALR